MAKGSRLRLVFLAAAGVVAVSLVAGLGYALIVWGSIEREDFDPEAAKQAFAAVAPRPDAAPDTLAEVLDDIDLPPPGVEVPRVGPDWERLAFEAIIERASDASSDTTQPAPLAPAPPAPAAPASVNAYLLVGSDGKPSFGRADVVFLLIDPADAGPILVSVPRSLYITNPCTGEPARLAVMLAGCPGVASGPNLVALALEDFTGVGVDGFAAVGYDGFVDIVDALGGVEICVDFPRGINGVVIIPTGCNLADGKSAQFYVTIRTQDELVDGQWRALEGDSASTRRQRQIEVIIRLYDRLTSFSSVGSLVSLGSSLSHTFVLSSGLSIGDASSIALGMRGAGLRLVSIPGEVATTAEGKYVINPTEPFKQTLARVYAPAAGW